MNGETLATVHGLFFLISGVWPLINIDSFQRITGPKTDLWLVKTVGLVIAAVGLTLILASYRKDVSIQTAILATSVSLSLAAVDAIYVAKKVISRIYLLDAMIELALVGGWLGTIISWA